jgi:hypothetical protein
MLCLLLRFSNLRLAKTFQRLLLPCSSHILVITYKFHAYACVIARIITSTNVGYICRNISHTLLYTQNMGTKCDLNWRRRY